MAINPIMNPEKITPPGSPGAMTALGGAGLVALARRCATARRGGLATRLAMGPSRKVGVARLASATVMAPPEEILGIKPDEKYNVPVGVREKLGKNLLLNEKHPLGILWKTVQDYFAEQDPDCDLAADLTRRWTVVTCGMLLEYWYQ